MASAAVPALTWGAGFPSLPTMPFSGLVNSGPPPANGAAQGEPAAANGGDEGLLRDMLSPVPSLLRGGEPSGRCARTAPVYTFSTRFCSYIMSGKTSVSVWFFRRTLKAGPAGTAGGHMWQSICVTP